MTYNRMERSMHAYVLGFVGALGIAVSIQTASATPSPPSHASVAGAPTIVPVAHHHCGKGRQWVSAGYAKGGKYRAGHCAPSPS